MKQLKNLKNKMLKNESLEKLKYWDNWFKLFGFMIILLLILSIVFVYFENPLMMGLFILFIAFLAVCLAFINWGMVYHKFKNKMYVWLVVDFILLFIGLITISSIIFYFYWMRPQFKKGKGNYK